MKNVWMPACDTVLALSLELLSNFVDLNELVLAMNSCKTRRIYVHERTLSQYVRVIL